MTVILVVHNGEEWLGSVLATVAAQRYPSLDLVVVNNGSRDGSGELLERRIDRSRLISLPRNVGFARAVQAALAHEAVEGADLLLLLHDDLVLAPDALGRLVAAMRADPSLAVVGPKLREWTDEQFLLQEVGMSADRFGRVENLVELEELDQGQHDRAHEVLFVSSAGMLLRVEALRHLGGFDPRFALFREDMDLCWRAWLAGFRVEVVPAAVGYHIAAASRHARAGPVGRPSEPRYFAERHALASLLKNYSTPRLLWVVPVAVLLALVKVAAFVATRRLGDAFAVVRAYVWNVAQLSRTLRRRRFVQSRRRMTDAELARLFAPGLPRFREYLEALGSWLAGGSTRALIDDAEGAGGAEGADGWTLWRMIRQHPAAAAGLCLLGVYLIGATSLLGSGQISGGEIAPWPSQAREFLRAYAGPLNGDPLASTAFASPVQPALGLLSLLALGSSWLAQRVLVLGLLPLAWLLALRAGRLITPLPVPRLVGATYYTLSPLVLSALAQGRYGALVLGAILPGLVLVAVRAADSRTPAPAAWRAVALLTLGLTVAISAHPRIAPLLLLAMAVLIVLVALRRRGWQPTIRLVVAVAGAVVLLGPWLTGLVRAGSVPPPFAADVPLPLWRAFGLAPELLPWIGGTGGVLWTATTLALTVTALLLATRQQPVVVALLLGVLGLSGAAAWGLWRAGMLFVWPSSVLFPGLLAVTALAVLAVHYLLAGMQDYVFGLRQITVAMAVLVTLLGFGMGLVQLASGPWEAIGRGRQLLPAFVAADSARVGSYRVLLLAPGEAHVRWDVVDGRGPRMVRFGALQSRELVSELDALVGALAGGGDPRAGARLGLLNVRYVVVSQLKGSDELQGLLTRQPALEPVPSSAGRVYRVTSWLPRAVVVPGSRGQALLETADPGSTQGLEEAALPPLRRGAYAGRTDLPEGGVLVVSEAAKDWIATGGEQRLKARDLGPVTAFAVPPGTDWVTVRIDGGIAHRLLVGLQLLLALVIVSLALRPPGFARARIQRATRRALPPGLVQEDSLLLEPTPEVTP